MSGITHIPCDVDSIANAAVADILEASAGPTSMYTFQLVSTKYMDTA